MDKLEVRITKPIQSLGTNQQEIINNILKLHSPSGVIDLDPCYSKGVFYKDGKVPQPKLKYDLFPQMSGVLEANSEDLPIDGNTLETIIFDPPFIITGKTYKKAKKGSSVIAKRFGGYTSFKELKSHYRNSLKEFYRILKEGGIVIMKLQNTISGGKQYFTHYFVMKEAIKLGFYPKDEFILHTKNKMTSFGGRWKNQIHAMKHHSYFLVLKKVKKGVDYD